MAAKTSNFATSLLRLLLQNVALPLIGDPAGLPPSAAPGNWFISLHIASPAAGNQTTSETTYVGYARGAIVRSAVGWTVAAGTGSNAAILAFGVVAGAPGPNITHVGLGTAAGGVGFLTYSGPLTAPRALVIGSTPRFLINALSLTET